MKGGEKMSSRSLLLVIIAVVLIGGGALFLASQSLNTQQTPVNTQQPVGGGPGDVARQEVKEIKVKGMLIDDPNSDGKLPRFDTEEIKVKQGDRVKIVFENQEGFHDWVVDEFAGARTARINANETATTEFVADKKGLFKFYCSVGNHRALGMEGNLIVE